MKIMKSAEDYLEMMLMLQEKHGYIRSVDIAAALGVSKPSVSYAAKRLETDADRIFSIRASKRNSDAEIENRSLYSYRESTYRKDIDAVAEDIVRAFELTRDGKEKKWFRRNSASARR